MIRLDDIIKATGGSLLSKGSEKFSGVSTDSRGVGKGELFVPLTGEKFDGHDYIGAALEMGAAGALSATGRGKAVDGKTIIEVADALRALQDMAHYVRMSSPGLTVIGITGTNGKTTTKEMLAAILAVRGPALKTEGNLNNHIGLPLTLLRLEKAHWAAAVEMGMSGFGEIARLAGIARPGIGVITNIGPGHLENLGSMEGVARAKCELIDALPAGGKAVLNFDDPYLRGALAANRDRTVSFGLGPGADVSASDIVEDDGSVSFLLTAPGGSAVVSLPVMGAHNVYNALAAAAAAHAAGLSAGEIKAGLESFRPVKMRMEVLEVGGARVINDAYNANPASMAAALTALASMKGGRKAAVLGDMMELGAASKKSHYDVGRLAGAEKISLLVVMGAHAADTARGALDAGMDEDNIKIVAGPGEAAAVLAERLRPGDRVLVKGSRSMRMERVVDLFRSGRLVA